MNANKLIRYINELGRVLKKRKVSELEKFMNEWKEDVSFPIVHKFLEADRNEKEIILNKMIYARKDLPQRTRDLAESWLLNKGVSIYL